MNIYEFCYLDLLDKMFTSDIKSTIHDWTWNVRTGDGNSYILG